MTEKEQFLRALEREIPTTTKVLKAYPAAKSDPSRTASASPRRSLRGCS